MSADTLAKSRAARIARLRDEGKNTHTNEGFCHCAVGPGRRFCYTKHAGISEWFFTAEEAVDAMLEHETRLAAARKAPFVVWAKAHGEDPWKVAVNNLPNAEEAQIARIEFQRQHGGRAKALPVGFQP